MAKHILPTILRGLEWVIFGAMLIIFLIIISPLLPTKKFISTYAVVSGSMSPGIPVGSLAFVQPISPDQLQVGQVIAFPDPEDKNDRQKIILHRIISFQKTGTIFNLKTKGDANNVEDPWLVTSSAVKGTLVASVPKLGYPIQFAQSPKGFILLIGVPAALLALLQMKTIKEGIDEEITKRTKLALQNQTQPAES